MTTPKHHSRSSKSGTVYLELDEVARLEKSTTNLRDRLLIRLLSHLGCRISEALGIAVGGIYLDAHTVTIQSPEDMHEAFLPSL